MLKKICKPIAIIFAIILLALGAILLIFTVLEYRPAASEVLDLPDSSQNVQKLSTKDSFSIMTWNIGYAGLDADSDFFMDGGHMVRPESKEEVEENLDGIASVLKDQNPDIYFLQEVDRDSKRSYHIDEKSYLEEQLGLSGSFAYNFKAAFVPYPLPMIGKVESGLLTMTNYKVSSATRISLPESFSWPIKTCNLKRCVMESHIQLENSDKELVLFNFHLEAYDDGEGKIAQMKVLGELLKDEQEKGNYVIAGGDFNQTFAGDDTYPITQDDWVPGEVSDSDLPDGYQLLHANNVPTCRLLNGPYAGNYQDSQVYVIDGFIVSDNITVKDIQNIDVGFKNTDHQPVKMELTLD